jgi:hypothetical protein
MIVTDYIKKEKFQQFHEILCVTGGRYLRKPLQLFDTVEVHYEPGDYAAECKAWRLCTAQIKEVRKDQVWRKILRKIKLACSCARNVRHYLKEFVR